jgi:hypothetical protein
VHDPKSPKTSCSLSGPDGALIHLNEKSIRLNDKLDRDEVAEGRVESMKLPARATAHLNIELLDVPEGPFIHLDAASNVLACCWASKHEHTGFHFGRPQLLAPTHDHW